MGERPLPGAARLPLSPAGRGDGKSPLPAGERAGSRSEPGEGLRRRGKTPEHLLKHARQMRHEPTPQEDAVWEKLRAGRLDGHKFRRQRPFGNDYVVDFCCPAAKVIVEIDGSQHADQRRYDERRTRFLQAQGYRVLRFWNNDVDGNMDGVVRVIDDALASPLPARLTPSRPSPLQGEG